MRNFRILALILTVLLLLGTVGCADNSGPVYETVAGVTDWDDDNSWAMARFYSTSALSDEGYYFPVDGMLYFADTSNGIAVCLCSKPGCLHEKGTPQEQELCDAQLQGANPPMFFWNDHIFYLGSDQYGPHVYRRNADGTALTSVADLGSRYVEEKKALLSALAARIEQKYGVGSCTASVKDSYYNMKEIIDENMYTVERAIAAMKAVGVEPEIVPIRGGTDGARLSFMGLPCPNICTGGENFHSRFEYLPVESLEKVVDIVERIVLDWV